MYVVCFCMLNNTVSIVSLIKWSLLLFISAFCKRTSVYCCINYLFLPAEFWFFAAEFLLLAAELSRKIPLNFIFFPTEFQSAWQNLNQNSRNLVHLWIACSCFKVKRKQLYRHIILKLMSVFLPCLEHLLSGKQTVQGWGQLASPSHQVPRCIQAVEWLKKTQFQYCLIVIPPNKILTKQTVC